MNNLNPDIRKVKIGRKDMREIEILPMSLADQLKMTTVIEEGVKLLTNEENLVNDTALVVAAIGFIRENLEDVLSLVTEGDTDELMSLITNDQAIEIGEIVYDVNYESMVKKVRNLLEKNQVKTVETEPIQ